MPKAPPQKGSTEWRKIAIYHPDDEENEHDLVPDEYRDVEIGIKYVGARKARGWGFEVRRLLSEERTRQLSKDEAVNLSEHYKAALINISGADGDADALRLLAREALQSEPKIRSAEFLTAWTKLQDSVLNDVVTGVRGLHEDERGKDEALEFIEYMGDMYESAVFQKAQEVQSLTLRQKFRPAGAGE